MRANKRTRTVPQSGEPGSYKAIMNFRTIHWLALIKLWTMAITVSEQWPIVRLTSCYSSWGGAGDETHSHTQTATESCCLVWESSTANRLIWFSGQEFRKILRKLFSEDSCLLYVFSVNKKLFSGVDRMHIIDSVGVWLRLIRMILVGSCTKWICEWNVCRCVCVWV